jgi:hypothetical protein
MQNIQFTGFILKVLAKNGKKKASSTENILLQKYYFDNHFIYKYATYSPNSV